MSLFQKTSPYKGARLRLGLLPATRPGWVGRPFPSPRRRPPRRRPPSAGLRVGPTGGNMR